MPSVFLIRHAKSDWNTGRDDFDRPLNERGRSDAPRMAARLMERQPSIDAVLTSPAVRAWSTAEYFTKAFNVERDRIILFPELYHPEPMSFYQVLEGLDDRLASVAVFSHNPGITEFVNQLKLIRLDDMPTCGIFGFQFSGHWKEIRTAEKQFLFFDYPKLG